jgi:hypothetical protein
MAAHRRRWPGEDDGRDGRAPPRRRSIGEWLEDEMMDTPRRSRRSFDENDKFETIAAAISMLEEKLEDATHANGPSRQRAYAGDGQDIQQQLPVPAQAFPGMGDPMHRAFNSSLGQQLQALGQRAGLPQGAQTYLPAPVTTGTNAMGIESLRRDVQTLRNSIRHSNEGRTMQSLEGEIRALTRKLNEGGISNSARDITEIKARMDHLNRVIHESGVNAKNGYLTTQLQRINENIARVQRPVLPERLVEDIRTELSEATRKLVPLSVHDAQTLEKNIQFLAERLDSLRARQPDNARLQALEEQLGRFTSQLSQTDVFTSIERMEKSLTDLGARINQGDGGGSLDNKTISVLRGFQKQIEDVKATADASEKRMHQTLHTLQDVIVKVAEKDGTTAVPKGDGSFGQRGGATIVAAAREAAAKATRTDTGADNTPQATLDLGDEPAAQRLENSFHAANAQMKQALRAETRVQQDVFEYEGRYAGNVTPFRRLKRYASQGLLAAAGVVLVIGVYNLLGPIINGEQTATASIVAVTPNVEQATGLSFTAPKQEAASQRAPATQLASVEPNVAPQKLNIALPAMPAAINQRLRSSAQNGDVRAFYEIGSRLIDGSRGVTRDVKLGLDWLQLAADQRHAPAFYRIASLYEKGQGIPRNVQQAVKNYQAASELGSRKSMHNLGALYASGIDGEPDLEKAIPLFKQAANLGLVDSQYNLAIIYVNGMGVKQDLTEAYKWFAIAAQNGDTESAKKRDEIGSRFDGKTLVKAKLSAQAFKPLTLDASANEDIIPAAVFADNKPAPTTADLSNIAPADGSGGTGLSIGMPQAN